MVYIIYSVVAILATTIGSITGLGGGVIMKPMFDLVGLHTPAQIGLYSSVAVFVMCVVSLYKQIKKGIKIHFQQVILISIGSFIGGIIGEYFFNSIMNNFSNIKLIQSSLLTTILILTLIYTLKKKKIKSFKIKSSVVTFLLGIILGSVAVFLGIGGGPINIAIFSLFFSLPMKDAVIYSLTTIFFSQVSKLLQATISGSFSIVDPMLVLCICIAAILGGTIGTKINLKSSDNKVRKIYIYCLIGLILLSLTNVIISFI
ncbi:MAG: sulfite exporter TauE/SafE family protein [Anaerorhabdus sp.]